MLKTTFILGGLEIADSSEERIKLKITKHSLLSKMVSLNFEVSFSNLAHTENKSILPRIQHTLEPQQGQSVLSPELYR